MLIVDDTEMNRAILKVIFEDKYEVMEAENGKEALEILERCQGSIDIVLLDLMMPNVNGFDIMEQKKDLDYFRNVPVVVITSSDTMEDQVRAFELGANDYIAKPFIPEIVKTRVDNVMASNRRMLSIEMEAQRMKIKSELDEMTGIMNKTTTENVIDNALRFSEGKLQALMIIDIDNFKTVNDTSGIVYKKVNELIQLMRYKPNIAIPEYVTLSIGLATNNMNNTTYPVLFKKADEALYQAKMGGKAQYREYGVELDISELDERPIVTVLSNNRTVCGMVHTIKPTQIYVNEFPVAIIEYAPNYAEIIRSNKAYVESYGNSSKSMTEGDVDSENVVLALKVFEEAVGVEHAVECNLSTIVQGKKKWTRMKVRKIAEIPKAFLLCCSLEDVTREMEYELRLNRIESILNDSSLKKKMLVIDDIEISREALRSLFKNDFEIIEAENGKQGLELLQKYQEDIEVILLDMVMPEMDGKEFLNEKNSGSETAEIPVIIISSEDDAATQIGMLQNGVNDYITKPFIPEITKQRVENVLAYKSRFNKLVKEYNKVEAKNE